MKDINLYNGLQETLTCIDGKTNCLKSRRLFVLDKNTILYYEQEKHYDTTKGELINEEDEKCILTLKAFSENGCPDEFIGKYIDNIYPYELVVYDNSTFEFYNHAKFNGGLKRNEITIDKILEYQIPQMR